MNDPKNTDQKVQDSQVETSENQELEPETEKELGEVEEAIEDYTLGIEDRA